MFPTYYRVEEHYQHIVGAGDQENIYAKLEIHSTVYQYRWIDGVKYLIYSYGHPAVVTDIGKNLTAGKLVGAGFSTTNYTMNVTYISLGAYTSLSNATTYLPNTWNISSSLTPSVNGIGNWNYTFSFYPAGSGVTNCTGLCWDDTDNGSGALWAYDTFADISYTSNDQIDVEWGIAIHYL